MLGTCSVVWLLAILGQLGAIPLAGNFYFELYPLYSLASVLGWVSGNLYVHRIQNLPEMRYRKRILLINYLLAPPSFLYLIRSLAPEDIQRAAPFVPLYAFAVYLIFFLVPVTLRPAPRRPLE